jgi:sporulation protein YlmC with PRC-barrel domain
MQIHVNQLFKFSLGATDGEIGKIKDIYFDDQSWTLRYLVAETGNWLFQRKVLIAPLAVQRSGLENEILDVNLTKEQVKDSPDIDTELPVSLQQESSLFDHYAWPSFGRAGMGWPTTGVLKGTSALINKLEAKEEFDPHLRSFNHVSKYEVYSSSVHVGMVKDLILDLSDWSIPFLLMENIVNNNSEQIMIASDKVSAIDWETSRISLSLTKYEINTAPRVMV